MLDLEPRHLQPVRSLLADLPAGYEVWAFGSRVTGKAQRFSDLDLVLKAPEPVPLTLLARLSQAFSDSTLPFTVDLVDWHSLPESLRKAIRETGVRVFPPPKATEP